MNNKIIQLCKEIQNRRNLEENIPQLFNHMADVDQLLAQIRLAMHYYTLYESYYDDENTWSREAIEIISKINNKIRANVLINQNGEERERAIAEVDGIRRDIMKRMSALTAYTDIFQIYEYVFNRVEYRFLEEAESLDEEAFSKEILRYIFDTEDNFIINEKIKEIIGQLPIRITKQKYFEVMIGSLDHYLGAQQSSLDAFLYMIRTTAMLFTDEEMKKLYPELDKKKEYLSGINYKEIPKDDFEKAKSVLNASTIILETETSVYLALQEIVNEVYAILLCTPYVGMTDHSYQEAKSAAVTIIDAINETFMQMEKKELSAELIDTFVRIEGVQEELDLVLESMETILFEMGQKDKELLQSLMLEKFYYVLQWSGILLSNSLFVEMNENKEDGIVEEERIKQEAEALEQELKMIFDSNDRMIGRAIMANTISRIPVFFKNHTEVMDYVRYSLQRCSDQYEKAACIEIINKIMSE